MKVILMVLLSVVLGVFGQLSMKQGMLQRGAVTLQFDTLIPTVWSMLTAPYVVLGLFLYAVSAVFWLVVLSRMEVSTAYPMLSLGYVLVALLSWGIWREQMSGLKLVSLGLICLGVILLSRS